MGKQLYEKVNGKYVPIFPKNLLENIKESEDGRTLAEVLTNFNSIYIPYTNSVEETRNLIPIYMRRKGLSISYNIEDNTITEYYKGSKEDIVEHWSDDDNWEVIPNLDFVRQEAAKLPDGIVTPNKLSPALQEVIKQNNNIVNLPDDEDLEERNGVISIKDKKYNPYIASGKGYKILRKNWVKGRNILTQDMINESNTIYEIRYDFDLNGAEIQIKEGCVLKFVGGSFSNGAINGSHTFMINCDNFNFKAAGSFITEPNLYIENFGAIGNNLQDDAPAIRKAFDFIRHCDNTCVLNFKKNAIYLLKTHNENVFFNVCSNIHINGNNSTFKIADNIGDFYKLFNCDKCENVLFSNFTIDENTTNNPVTSLTGKLNDVYSRVLFWGWNRMRNVILTNIIMKDVVGVWQFTFGYSENVDIKDCKIIYNTSSENLKYDRTSIYMGGNNCSVKSCELVGDFKNANTAIEFHGSNIIAEKNKIIGYAGGVLLVNDEASDTIDNKNLIVRNNYIYTTNGCLALWFSFDNRNVDGVYITENILKYKKNNAVRVHHDTGSNCAISNILIKDNKISIDNYNDNSYTFYFDHLYTSKEVVNTVFNNFIIRENLISGEQNIVFYLEGSDKKSIPLYDNLNIRNNIITNCVGNVVKVINVQTTHSYINNNFVQNFSDNKAAIVQYGSLSSNIKYEYNIINNLKIEKNVAETANKISGIFIVDYNIRDISNLSNKYNESSFIIFKNGTVLLKKDINNAVIPICCIESDEVPKGLYITKGSVIKTKLNTYKVNTTGIIPNHIVGSQINKVGEYVCTERGRYIYEVINENNKTTIINGDTDFKDKGERAFYSSLVKTYIMDKLPFFTQSEIMENAGSLFISPTSKTISSLSEDGKLYSADGIEFGIKRQGIFNDKPSNPLVGFTYFCTDKQTTEGATNGIVIYYKGNNVWVDALGRIVR